MSWVRGEETVLWIPFCPGSDPGRWGGARDPPAPLPDPARGDGGVGWGRGGRADSPPAASSDAGIFFLIIECEV